MGRLAPCACFVGMTAFAVLVSGRSTPAQDVEAMAKWTALTVVHYLAVGEYSGTQPFIAPAKEVSMGWSVPVTDRVEIEFDWDQQEMKLVGKSAIRNFPSKPGGAASIQGPAAKLCPQPKPAGAVEVATVSNLRDTGGNGTLRLSGVVEFDAKRDVPGGEVPLPETDTTGNVLLGCGKRWGTAAQTSSTSTMNFLIPPAMALAMPGAIPISADKKSLIVKGKEWTWTFTPSPVK